MSGTKRCMRNSCGKEYTEDFNLDGECRYHPGVPIFHEGLKGWSCCDKRFTDFSEFLEYPGCTVGVHSDVKPELPPKQEEKKEQEYRAPIDPSIRMRSTAAKLEVPLKPLSSLLDALAKLETAAKQELESQEIKIGQSCTNNACKGTYQGDESNSEVCKHHPGAPVFHEGMKYWSCCSNKKTHDFDEFLARPGCAEATHRWVKPKAATAKPCRYDWFQTEGDVCVTILAKNIDPFKSFVKANADSLTISILYEQTSLFNLDLHMFRDILPESVVVTVMTTKMEIKMKKAVPANWEKLVYS